jgi:hypothetical protein
MILALLNFHFSFWLYIAAKKKKKRRTDHTTLLGILLSSFLILKLSGSLWPYGAMRFHTYFTGPKLLRAKGSLKWMQAA